MSGSGSICCSVTPAADQSPRHARKFALAWHCKWTSVHSSCAVSSCDRVCSSSLTAPWVACRQARSRMPPGRPWQGWCRQSSGTHACMLQLRTYLVTAITRQHFVCWRCAARPTHLFARASIPPVQGADQVSGPGQAAGHAGPLREELGPHALQARPATPSGSSSAWSGAAVADTRSCGTGHQGESTGAPRIRLQPLENRSGMHITVSGTCKHACC